MEETSIRDHAHGTACVSSERRQQRQFPLRRIRALQVGAPDVAARVADEQSIGKAITVGIGRSERGWDAVNELRVFENITGPAGASTGFPDKLSGPGINNVYRVTF